MQKKVRKHLHSEAVLLGLLLYSDASEAQRKGHKFHPLNLYIANFTTDALRSQRGHVRLAHMSVLDREKDHIDLSDKKYERCVNFVNCAAFYARDSRTL